MIRVSAVSHCASRADDRAFASLADAVRVTDDLPDVRVIGGHMVGLLLAAFPVAGLSVRRTTDADAGITTQIAASDIVIQRLFDLGYRAPSSNRLVLDGRTIDLLVDSPDSHFRQRDNGDRQFDASPGLNLALDSEPIEIETTVIFTDGHEEHLSVRVPTIEVAVILKSYAAKQRVAAKDLADLYSLLEIRHAHGVDATGGWRLDRESAMGGRLDANRILRTIRSRDSRFDVAGVPRDRFIALVSEYTVPL